MVGQNIGKYRVLDRVGRGGMGTVYRAIDETLHREVAIKVLNAELNDPEVGKRFRAEAITVARLNHPGIATIYELFQHEGQWLMVMEYVRGETLEHMIERSGGLSPQRSAEICLQSLAALAHAHSMGVVHRDLKPANLMITETGAIKIMDFGIARVAGTEHLTSAGFMMGTPAYMAPEQVMGQEIDARADLYAIGVVFYRLTTAKLPFKGDTPFAMAQSQVHDAPTPIGMFRTDLPPWVEPIVVKSLAKSPEERFQSAVEFHEAFARCLAGLPMATAYHSSAASDLMMTPARPMSTAGLHSTPPTPRPAPPPLVSHPIAQRPAPPTPTTSARTPIDEPPETMLTPAATPATPATSATSETAVDAPPTTTAEIVARAATGVVPPKKKAASSVGIIVAGVGLLAVAGTGAWYLRHRAQPPPPVDPSTGGAISNAPPGAAMTTAPPAPAPPPSTGSTGGGSPPSPATGAPVTAAPAPGDPSLGAARGARNPAPAPGAPSTTAPAVGATGRAEMGRGGPIDDPHEVFTDVKVLVVNGKKTTDRDVVLSFGGGETKVLGTNGGTLNALPYRSMASLTYARARDPRWNTNGYGPPKDLDVGSFMRTSKHWLVVQTADSYLIFRLEDANIGKVLHAFETRTGLVIDRPKTTDK